MADIVERLRSEGASEAADEIERLRKRIDQLIEISAVEIRLRADEIERLRAATPDRYYELEAWGDSQAAEIERLRGLLAWHDSTVPEILADNTRLRAVLHQLVSEGKISPNIARELLGWVTIEASP